LTPILTPALSLRIPSLQKTLPINKSFSFIWKEKTYAVSHAPAEALPIMPVYRKEEGMIPGLFVANALDELTPPLQGTS